MRHTTEKKTTDIKVDVSSITTHRVMVPLPEVRVEMGDEVEVFLIGPHGKTQKVRLTYSMVSDMEMATRGLEGY